MIKHAVPLLLALVMFSTPRPASADQPGREAHPLAGARVLVFTKTAGFRHGSIDAGVAMFQAVGDRLAVRVTHSEDAGLFTPESLTNFDAVVFLNTTGDVLNDPQQEAFEAYIRGGGGYLGVHSASDTEYDWAFYGKLVGAYFAGHPPVQEARIDVLDRAHAATSHLGPSWTRRDEWYNFRAQPEHVRVLMTLDTGSYEGSTMDPHPIAWCREIGTGRSFYTAGGHTNESFAEAEFQRHLLGALAWVTRRDAAEKPRGDGATEPLATPHSALPNRHSRGAHLGACAH